MGLGGKGALAAALLGFAGFLAGAPAAAQEARGGSFLCQAVDESNNIHLHSATFRADPAVSIEDYEQSWKSWLAAQRLPTRGGCTFTDEPDRIPAYLEGMKQQCDTCSVWTLRQVEWTFKSAAASTGEKKNLAAEICEPLGYTEQNHRELSLAEGKDAQLRAFCGQSYEYWTMYQRALRQGHPQAELTWDAHRKSAQVLQNFWQETRTDR